MEQRWRSSGVDTNWPKCGGHRWWRQRRLSHTVVSLLLVVGLLNAFLLLRRTPPDLSTVARQRSHHIDLHMTRRVVHVTNSSGAESRDQARPLGDEQRGDHSSSLTIRKPVVVKLKGETDNSPDERIDVALRRVTRPRETMARRTLGGKKQLAVRGRRCPPKYGRIDVFVAVVTSSYKNFYQVAQSTLKCYLKSTNYRLRLVDLDTDKRVAKHCPQHTQLFFRKHCAASVYLEDADWMMVLDADTGVVNPEHCLEEYIDDSVDIVFYERFFNWEVASGNYLVKNTPWARRFLRQWSDYQFEQPSNWNGGDNGVLQMHLLETLQPDVKPEIRTCHKIWRNASGFESYMRFVTCCKVALGARRVWPGQVKIFRRGHGWVRDGFLTSDKWCQRDFMLHGWKLNQTDIEGWQSPFKHILNVSECTEDLSGGWPHRENYRVSTESIKKELKDFERSAANSFPKKVTSALTLLASGFDTAISQLRSLY